tara:strand:- start:27 stop:818 length:792 start_codon:yes stop_codon:yes gene_type:complete
MNTKKSLAILFLTIFLTSLVVAQNYKMDISTIPEDKIFKAGDSLQIKITLYDESNNPINDQVSIILQDMTKEIITETTIQSNKNFEEIKIKENTLSGEGKIIAKYKESEIEESFFIEKEELAKFEIKGDDLIVTNIGNTKYSKTIYITIGETTGTKTPDLNIGKSISYKLVAPEGVYNIKVTDRETTITQGEVTLAGTGQAIGAIDRTSSQRSGITGGIASDEDEALLSYMKQNKFVYVFVLVIFGAMILLAIERRYRLKAKD